MSSLLSGKKAFVTGGSRGIGRAIALELAAEGAEVSFSFKKNKEAADETLGALQKISKERHSAIAFDVSDLGAVEKGIGECHILVNNAGVTRDNLLLTMKSLEWNEVISTNLTGMFHCTKVAAKGMLKRKWGRIINISSTAGQFGNAGQSNYSASKAGVIGFTKSVAKELASRNITVNVVAPGFIKTDMTEIILKNEKLSQAILQTIPLGHFGSCEDIALLVTFLASDRAKYITGQVIGVNGGLYM